MLGEQADRAGWLDRVVVAPWCHWCGTDQAGSEAVGQAGRAAVGQAGSALLGAALAALLASHTFKLIGAHSSPRLLPQWWLPPSASTASGSAAPSCPPSPPSSRQLAAAAAAVAAGACGVGRAQCGQAGRKVAAAAQHVATSCWAPFKLTPDCLLPPGTPASHPRSLPRRCGSARASTTRAAPPSCTASASKRVVCRYRPARRSRRAGSRRAVRRRTPALAVPSPPHLHPRLPFVPAPCCLCHSR